MELGMELKGQEILLPTVIAADSDKASERVAREMYPTSRLLRRHDVPLSQTIDPVFARVNKWKKGKKYIPIGDFRDHMRIIFAEGRRMAEWRINNYSPFRESIEPQYPPFILDHVHDQVQVPTIAQNGAEFVVFPDKEEALWFIAAMLRETMAQALQRTTRGN
jgi:hypothetical protein